MAYDIEKLKVLTKALKDNGLQPYVVENDRQLRIRVAPYEGTCFRFFEDSKILEYYVYVGFYKASISFNFKNEEIAARVVSYSLDMLNTIYKKAQSNSKYMPCRINITVFIGLHGPYFFNKV